MKKLMRASMLGSLIALNFAQATGMESKSATFDRVTIFQVALQCPAAPQIGCGSAAKPILLKLERDLVVREAWLNRTGTLIAVVWKSEVNSQTQQDFKSRLRGAGCCAKDTALKELQGEARDQALKELQSGHGWYRGAEVDRLSEEEAGVIAARLVRRVQAKTTMAQDKAERLERVLTDAYKKCFAEERYEETLPVREVVGDFLDEKQIAILKQGIEDGVRPLPNEN